MYWTYSVIFPRRIQCCLYIHAMLDSLICGILWLCACTFVRVMHMKFLKNILLADWNQTCPNDAYGLLEHFDTNHSLAHILKLKCHPLKKKKNHPSEWHQNVNMSSTLHYNIVTESIYWHTSPKSRFYKKKSWVYQNYPLRQYTWNLLQRPAPERGLFAQSGHLAHPTENE